MACDVEDDMVKKGIGCRIRRSFQINNEALELPTSGGQTFDAKPGQGSLLSSLPRRTASISAPIFSMPKGSNDVSADYVILPSPDGTQRSKNAATGASAAGIRALSAQFIAF